MGIKEDLSRWVDAGLIDVETASAIEKHETQRSGSNRIGRGVEAVAYLGAVLILLALVVFAVQFWDRLEQWGRFGLGLIVALVLFVVGWVLGRADEPAVRRAQMLAWFLTVLATGLAAQVGFEELLEFDDPHVFLWVAVVSLVVAVVLWGQRQSALQLVAMGLAAGTTVVALVSLLDGAPDWSFGLSLAGLGVVWLFLTWGGVLQPVRTGYVLAAIGALAIAFPDASELPWPLIGLGVGLGLMALSVRLDQAVLLGMGVAGLFLYIPILVFEVFGESLGVPLALLITGLVLLGVVMVSVRLRTPSRP
jgi:hypothetical protein